MDIILFKVNSKWNPPWCHLRRYIHTSHRFGSKWYWNTHWLTSWRTTPPQFSCKTVSSILPLFTLIERGLEGHRRRNYNSTLSPPLKLNQKPLVMPFLGPFEMFPTKIFWSFILLQKGVSNLGQGYLALRSNDLCSFFFFFFFFPKLMYLVLLFIIPASGWWTMYIFTYKMNSMMCNSEIDIISNTESQMLSLVREKITWRDGNLCSCQAWWFGFEFLCGHNMQQCWGLVL